MTNIRQGTRCGTVDSIEADIQNVSTTLYLRGYVIYDTLDGRVFDRTGLMKPGQKGNSFACHAAGAPTALAETRTDKDHLNYPPQPWPHASGLALSTCDPNPDALEHACNVRKLECDENSPQWCDQIAKVQGQPDTDAYKRAYSACLDDRMASCEASQSECLAKITRFLNGEACIGGAARF